MFEEVVLAKVQGFLEDNLVVVALVLRVIEEVIGFFRNIPGVPEAGAVIFERFLKGFYLGLGGFWDSGCTVLCQSDRNLRLFFLGEVAVWI